MKKENISCWIYSRDPDFVSQKDNDNFYSEIICYRQLKDDPSLKAISTIYWIPQSRVYFGVVFRPEKDSVMGVCYRLEGNTFESVRLKLDLKLVEMNFKVDIF